MYAGVIWTLTLLFFLTSCRWCVSSSCVIVGLHVCTHSQGDLCDRPLAKMGRWVCLCSSTRAVCAWLKCGRIPWKHQSCTSFGWKFFLPLSAQTSPKKVEPKRLIWGWGDWLMEPCSLRCCILIHPRVASGCVGLAVQDATSVKESLVPTFAYLYSSAVPSPPLLCLCSINLQNRARLVISPWSLFLLISLQNRLTWTLLFQGLMCSPCQAVVQAVRFALNGTRRWNLVFVYR